ncbi:MAG: hypothetical protein DRH89_03605, partial [Candidatus Cloacimonadota bacterium]
IASEQVVFDSAYAIIVSDTFATFIKKDIEAEIKPELLNITYAFNQPLEIYINNVLVEKEAEMRKELTHVGDELLPQYNVSTSMHITSGKNNIIFKIPSGATKENAVTFAAALSLQFDEEKFAYHKTTEQLILVSDFSWMTKKEISEGIEVSVPDTLNNPETTVSDSTAEDTHVDEWIPANHSNFKFFKAQMYGMESSEAVDIWYPVIDSHNVETVVFKKEFEISGEVINASLKCIGQNTVTIWINDQLIVEDKGIVVDDRLKKIQPFEYSVEELIPGMNTIEIEVNGGKEYKGLIFEMNYRAKKKLTE